MKNVEQRLAGMGIYVPDILIPRPDIALDKWATIACDQFTQDPGYWDSVRDYVGNEPSTFHLIYPEAFLGRPDREASIRQIHGTMHDYMPLFAPAHHGCVYLERETAYQPRRRGLVVCIDLEHYDWKTNRLIRTTEYTIQERLPVRAAVRRGAPLELSHVIVLIDDPDDTLLPYVAEQCSASRTFYETNLGIPMVPAGSVRAWLLDSPHTWHIIADYFEKVLEKNAFWGAVGDGNHSLASAKLVWEECKKSGAADRASRYALVEIENIHDDGVHFEPIHRLIYGVESDTVIEALTALPGFRCRPVEDSAELPTLINSRSAGPIRLGIVSGSRGFLVETESEALITTSLQPVLDRLIQPGATLDYIHGDAELLKASAEAVGILLPPIQKTGFFHTIASHGMLPRKSFSMGEAAEKRFYIECRAL
jgi:hypothetical protein